ncbi:UNVERIFIED_CONTAM: hypothetical protein NCL1_27450 [Trichonephila clavipes]
MCLTWLARPTRVTHWCLRRLGRNCLNSYLFLTPPENRLVHGCPTSLPDSYPAAGARSGHGLLPTFAEPARIDRAAMADHSDPAAVRRNGDPSVGQPGLHPQAEHDRRAVADGARWCGTALEVGAGSASCLRWPDRAGAAVLRVDERGHGAQLPAYPRAVRRGEAPATVRPAQRAQADQALKRM